MEFRIFHWQRHKIGDFFPEFRLENCLPTHFPNSLRYMPKTNLYQSYGSMRIIGTNVGTRFSFKMRWSCLYHFFFSSSLSKFFFALLFCRAVQESIPRQWNMWLVFIWHPFRVPIPLFHFYLAHLPLPFNPLPSPSFISSLQKPPPSLSKECSSARFIVVSKFLIDFHIYSIELYSTQTTQ